MTQLEAIQEAITALSNSETLSRRCAEQLFNDDKTTEQWLTAAANAKTARAVLADMLATFRKEGDNHEPVL